MRFGILVLAVLLAAGVLSIPLSQTVAQDQESDTRGAFMTSRPKTGTKSSTPNHHRPKSNSGAQASNTGKSTTGGTLGAKNTNTTSDTDKKGPASAPRIGLGLTLFMRDANGLAVRVDPTHEFHQGDAVRVLLETNVSGHLYIFNTTDGGSPVMIYPDAQLDTGGNYLEAHLPVEIPSSMSNREGLRWFRFDEKAGSERLMFVFSRDPLQGVPIEDDLVKFCAEKKDGCAFRPSAALWGKLQQELNDSPQVAKATAVDYGIAQTTAEHEASTRGIGLSKDDPAPSLVLMSTSAGSALLVTALDLIHK